MKVRELIQFLLKPFIVIALFIITITFTAYFIGRPEKNWTQLQFLLWIFDLRSERNLATFFEGLLFFSSGVLLIIIGKDIHNNIKTPNHIKYVIIFLGIAFCFLTVDEILSIHEGIGVRLERNFGHLSDTPIGGMGFSWLLVYAPAGALGFLIALYAFGNIITKIPSSYIYKRRIKWLLSVAPALLFGALMLEFIEGLLMASGDKNTIFPCFEESMEVFALICLIAGTLHLAEFFDS